METGKQMTERPINWEKLHYDFKMIYALTTECQRLHPDIATEHTKIIWDVYLNQWQVVDKLDNFQIMEVVEDYRKIEHLLNTGQHYYGTTN
jgi:hypothetical protein